MFRFSFLILFFHFQSFGQQSSIKSLEFAKINTDDYWEEELSPMTGLMDIVRYIHSDPFREDFIANIPAGNPLVRDISVNSFFGMRKHPVDHVSKFHRGIDLQGTFGELVISSGNGTVYSCGFDAHLGNFVKIRHKYGFESIYGHLTTIKVKSGQHINHNQLIGTVGATGKVTGPHLHYTLKKNGEYIDPFDFLFMQFKDDI